MWLKVEGFKDLLQSLWSGFSFSGSYSYILTERLKALKAKLKVWNKGVFGNVLSSKERALNQEGDRNTSFFHKMVNAHRRRHQLAKIKINGCWVSEESEIKEGVVRAFQVLLFEIGEWRPTINELSFEVLGEQDAANLEVPFFEEEVFTALSELREDKAPGWRVSGRSGDGVDISHLLFVNDTLSINLEKSELIPVGMVENVEGLALEFGCKVGALPSSYLGLPLGALFRSVVAWDGVEERFRKKLYMWKR
ncbi:hypothetical protein CK203_079541 [Vitis vinifera]|uniref:Reverse transcriptase domain-containing protein n=1 Tax=Vitis vinifera TaxID=29760 RepID=A0A438CNZ1_VITVI|nr:hypothetical protein CK203_079541 [Vitis vinifera]